MNIPPEATVNVHRPGALRARHGLVLVHGRGGTAQDILALGRAIAPENTAMIAPKAPQNSWWPVSFLAPMARLQPWLDQALAAMDQAVATLEAEGLARSRIALAGFSQGACLALEYAARRGGPWHGVIALSGGLVGTADAGGAADPELYGHFPKRFDHDARLDAVRVLIACHEHDPHIPRARVMQSAQVLRAAGARLELRLHPGAGHGPGPGDLDAARALLEAATAPGDAASRATRGTRPV